ncbi:GNAT family N-acetyltransferase [Lacticaseibacillus salsurivasis]|uniref:GNAT family N-acetyltransferase n=1 Tax=Lacticaseibacillus salsurivasis TaxID=3081441 RepID=UPI0030C69900
MTLMLRQLTLDDAKAYASFRQDWLTHDLANLYAESQRQRMRQRPTVAAQLTAAKQQKLPVLQAELFLFDGPKLVGRLALRWHLTAELRHGAGNIGYSVAPSSRGHGYAKFMLKAALAHYDPIETPFIVISASAGNKASQRVIESCGGQLTERATEDGEELLIYHLTPRSEDSRFPARLMVEPGLSLRIADFNADAEVLFKLIDSNRAFLGRWLTWLPSVQTVEDEQRILQRQALERELKARYLLFWQEEIIGSLAVTPLDSATAELGYWLLPTATGQGYMTKAVKKVLEVLPFRTFVIHAAVGNQASNALAQRAGFVKVRQIANLEHLASGVEDGNEWVWTRPASGRNH